MSPAELTVVAGHAPDDDLLANVTALVKRAAHEPLPTRAEAITRAAHGIIRDQQQAPAQPAAAPVGAEPEHVETLRKCAAFLAGLETTLRPIARQQLLMPIRNWQREITALADQLGHHRTGQDQTR